MAKKYWRFVAMLIAGAGIGIALSSLFESEANEDFSDADIKKAKEFVMVIGDPVMGLQKAMYSNDGYIFIAVDAKGDNYDMLAEQYADMAKDENVKIKGVFVVDSKTAKFGNGWVEGDRIGFAKYKKD